MKIVVYITQYNLPLVAVSAFLSKDFNSNCSFAAILLFKRKGKNECSTTQNINGGFQLTSLALCWWTRTKAFHSVWSKTFCPENTTKKNCCFVHQYGCLLTWLKTSNRPLPSCPKALFKREFKFEATDIN